MQAITFSKFGDSSVLEYQTIATPLLTEKDNTDCVLVRVHAAGVNPVDHKLRKGEMTALVTVNFPAIPGIDYAGVIAAVQAGYSGPLKVGDRVYGKTANVQDKGPYAQYIKLDTKVDLVVPLPANVSFNDAGGVAVVALTAYVGLVPYGGLSKNVAENVGRKVLVIGASGGVGMFVVQMAKLLGAHVTAVASGKNKDFVLNTLGADVFLDYTTAPLTERLSTKNEFDVIYDTVAGDKGKNWELAQTILKSSGLFVSPVPPFDGPVSVGNMASMMGTMAWRGVTSSRRYRFISSAPVSDFPMVAEWIANGSLKLVTSVALPLAEAKKAQELSETGRTVGKIVLNP
ncbi:chaperonin 10-like protein [Chytriomyces cf. hyalinus JEL632]|nr:chaperonin 10-like protein [Chytriomyces cf. hyalinus JEL632]